VFQYSPRQGTPAASFENQVTSEVKEKRSRALIDLGNKLQQRFLEQFIGKELTVLFEDESLDREGYIEGYTDHYVKAIVPKAGKWEGELLPVLIDKYENDCLTGRIIEGD
jgi:threonylcarbamoyladenosine tRNA methylthiotransferase MtaB